MRLRALVVAGSGDLPRRLVRLLRRHAVDAQAVSDVEELRRLLPHEDLDLVLIARSLLPQPFEGFITSILTLPEHPDVIVMTEREDPQERAGLLAAGSIAVLFLGLSDAPLSRALGALLQRRSDDALQRLQVERRDRRYRLDDFASASPSMQSFLAMVRRVVTSDSPLLILGETGVGKERLARAIHMEGPRSHGPFIAINCAALPESLLESELFGHEAGAFTGATRPRRGYFQLADQGTIFLDEVGELPVHLQAKLLRVLEDRFVQRLGSERPIPVDVRIIAAANRNLEADLEQRRFRLDLYYRLAVVTLSIPPLRDRREDISQIAGTYLRHFRSHLGRSVSGIRPVALEALERHDWPGNVRELINVIERAVLLCPGEEIGLADLPPSITGLGAVTRSWAHADALRATGSTGELVRGSWVGRPLRAARREVMAAFERAYLDQLLTAAGGRVGRAARRAGISPRSLYELMRRHGIRKEGFKRGGENRD